MCNAYCRICILECNVIFNGCADNRPLCICACASFHHKERASVNYYGRAMSSYLHFCCASPCQPDCCYTCSHYIEACPFLFLWQIMPAIGPYHLKECKKIVVQKEERASLNLCARCILGEDCLCRKVLFEMGFPIYIHTIRE